MQLKKIFGISNRIEKECRGEKYLDATIATKMVFQYFRSKLDNGEKAVVDTFPEPDDIAEMKNIRDGED